MKSKILDKKRIVENNKGDVFLDLSSRSMLYDESGDVIKAFYVGEDMSMRPDLVSHVVYGNTDAFDLILKYNGISNPFSLGEDMLILVPDLSFMYSSMYDPTPSNESEDVRKQYMDSNKSSNVDPNKIRYNASIKKLRKGMSGGKFSSYNLPPNIAEPGDKEGKLLNNGSVVFGQDITKKTR